MVKVPCFVYSLCCEIAFINASYVYGRRLAVKFVIQHNIDPTNSVLHFIPPAFTLFISFVNYSMNKISCGHGE